MERYLRSKSGYTLVEMLVGMGIFSIIMTMAAALFATMVKTYSDTSVMMQVQQDGRIISEVMNRYAKEAKVVTIEDEDTATNCGTKLKLSQNITGSSGYRFSYKPTEKNIDFERLLPIGNNINSEYVSVDSFQICRPRPTTYPKYLTYSFSLSAKGVQNYKMDFSGVINTRNEL